MGFQVEELQKQLHAKSKDVDTATSALANASEEVQQLQKVIELPLLINLFIYIVLIQLNSNSCNLQSWQIRPCLPKRGLSMSCNNRCLYFLMVRQQGPQSSRLAWAPSSLHLTRSGRHASSRWVRATDGLTNVHRGPLDCIYTTYDDTIHPIYGNLVHSSMHKCIEPPAPPSCRFNNSWYIMIYWIVSLICSC